MKNLLILPVVCFFYLFSSNLSGQDDQITFQKAFDVNDLNKVELKFDSLYWRRDVYYTDEFVEAVININDTEDITVKIARKGNSSNFNTMSRDKIPFKIDGPKSFNFKLNNNYRDYSMGAREYLAYRLHQKFTGIGCQTAATEVYVDGAFYGLYLAVEDLNRKFYETNLGGVTHRIKGKPVVEDSVAGTFYSNLFWLGEESKHYEKRYEFKKGSVTDLIKVIDIINNNPEEAFKYIDIDQVCRFLAVENYLMNTGGIIGEVYSHNFEFVKRKTDGIWQLVPWDLNLCLGGWSKTAVAKSENPIDILTGMPPTSGRANNALIGLIMDHFFFLYHYHYINLLKEYDDDLLLSWADEFRSILQKSKEIDEKLYDEEHYEKAYTENIKTIDGFVTGLIPTIEKRYEYLQDLELERKFSNKIRGVNQTQDTVFVTLSPQIENEPVVIEYLNESQKLKRLRAQPTRTRGSYYCVLPSETSSYYVYTYFKGVKYSFPHDGVLNLKVAPSDTNF